LTAVTGGENISSLSAFDAIRVGQRIGPFEIVMPYASGGMAQVFVAKSTGFGNIERFVALKCILPAHAGKPLAVSMFLDEARVAASMDHPNVAKIFDFGEANGRFYIAMEFVHGVDLRALLQKIGDRSQRLAYETAIAIARGVAAALDHAHQRCDPKGKPLKIVHRDVSPVNILVSYEGAVKLVDFGIAKAAERSNETVTGIIKGKAAYMSPEQCRGSKLDHRSDVFSLGILLYEMATGQRCFRAHNDHESMLRIALGQYPKPSQVVANFPVPLEAIIAKALAVDVEQRFASAAAMQQALENLVLPDRADRNVGSLSHYMRALYGDVAEPWVPAPTKTSPLLRNIDYDSDESVTIERNVQADDHLVREMNFSDDVGTAKMPGLGLANISSQRELDIGDRTSTDPMVAPLDLGNEPTVIPSRQNIVSSLAAKREKPADATHQRSESASGAVTANAENTGVSKATDSICSALPHRPHTVDPLRSPALVTGASITQSYFVRSTQNSMKASPAKTSRTWMLLTLVALAIGAAVVAWQLLR
jgi:serine/threonine protein kinase